MTVAFGQELGGLALPRFLARDLHDGVGQNLVYLRLELSHLASLTPDPTEMGEHLRRLERVAQEGYDELRTALGLMRSRRGPGRFQDEIQECVRSVQANTGLLIDLVMQCGEEPVLLPRAVTYHVKAVVRQALWNSWLHANAATRRVVVERKENGLYLTIEDDGCGFDLTCLSRDGHYGLAIMRERAKAIGGRLQIVSAPDHGTVIRLVIPKQSTRPGRLAATNSKRGVLDGE